MISKLNYYWWYAFFTIYWTVKELGTKGLPQSNAKGYLQIFVLLNLVAFFQTLLFFWVPVTHWIVVVICYFISEYITWRSFIHKDKYLKKINEFQMIKFESKKRRYTIMILIAVQSMIYSAGIATLRNIYDTL